MTAEYDAAGNYKYPEGFDPDTQEWRDGFDTQREAWEADYAKAHERWEAHKTFVAKQDAAAARGRDRSARGQEARRQGRWRRHLVLLARGRVVEGTLASDERLAALREKLTGN